MRAHENNHSNAPSDHNISWLLWQPRDKKSKPTHVRIADLIFVFGINLQQH